MRTQEEIKNRIKEVEQDDFFGTQTNDLIECLDLEQAKDMLKPEGYEEEKAKPEKERAIRIHTDDEIKKRIVDYLDFAWDKASGHRGLSANRSIDHFKAWVWLIGDDEALAFLNDEKNYPRYGAPMLKYLSERFGYNRTLDSVEQSMADGESCRPYCRDGCDS